jgi:hypothetical protein
MRREGMHTHFQFAQITRISAGGSIISVSSTKQHLMHSVILQKVDDAGIVSEASDGIPGWVYSDVIQCR